MHKYSGAARIRLQRGHPLIVNKKYLIIYKYNKKVVLMDNI